ncbi:rhamnulokinase [Nocardioides terrae]|uniref:Rhamnulokinase n=1 Tax=Nocardioides terrae TaxID=574651 RepID=A0A1I1INY3_9ACTN|nr:rhamnulokinase family protein [Nocardioides terrae]SFC34940.1 rhamnulokinase [Nocardioides terrae]
MSRQELRLAAVDLGATSGRVMAAVVGRDRLELTEVHRFPNAAVQVGDELVWDVVGIHREVLAGLRKVAATGPVHGIGIDSWAVDYGLLDGDGRLLGNAVSHRDRRTAGIPARVYATVPAPEIYAVTGLQELPFNTVFQLVAATGSAALESARTLLLLPDLLGYWLTGEVGAERTNASTTGLYDASTREWAVGLVERLGLPSTILPPLRSPGEIIGRVRPALAAELDLREDVPVIAVASHDTASAVVGVPAGSDSFAYISSGTWSLVGVELDKPVLSEAARRADFTNEGGLDGTVRFLKNVTGLWVLSECVRSWSATGEYADLPGLLDAAAGEPALRTVVDIDDVRLLAPTTADDPMPERVLALAEEAGEPTPASAPALVRCILDSLALAYRRHLRTALELSGRSVDVVHVVGGGSQNALLCQLTADACGLPVIAGPSEAAAVGNALVQARALGADLPDLAAMRALLRRTSDLGRFEPRPGLDWPAAERRVPLT